MPEGSSQLPADAQVRVFIEDHTGNKRREARMAANAAVRDLVPALITALGLPATDPSGRPVTYHLAFGNRQLQGDETLASADVADGANLTIVPEMTAGVGTAAWPLLTLISTGRSEQPSSAGFAATEPVSYQLSSQTAQRIAAHASSHHDVEVGGLLMGHVNKDATRYLVNITDALPAFYTDSTRTSLTFTARTWTDLIARREPGQKTVGWYHTHPGFGVFLSASDQFLHQSFFGDEAWYLALVHDPSSGDQAVFGWQDRRIVRCSAPAASQSDAGQWI